MDEFPSNSQNVVKKPEKQEKATDDKKIEKVVTGEVVQRKKPLGKRMA